MNAYQVSIHILANQWLAYLSKKVVTEIMGYMDTTQIVPIPR